MRGPGDFGQFLSGKPNFAVAAALDCVSPIDAIQPSVMRLSFRPGRRVEAERRRRPSPAPSGGRPRADAPQRRRDSADQRDYETGGGSTGGGMFGSGSGTGGTGGPRFRSGKSGGSVWSKILTGVIVVVVIGLWLNDQFNSGGTSLPGSIPTDNYGAGQLSSVAPAGDFTTDYPSLPAETPAMKGQTWLVMLYQDADDQILEKDIYLDLNEAEKAGASDRVTVVAQIDRYNGAYSGDGNWTGAKRFLISQDDDLGRVTSQEVADLGEVNMSSGQTLVDFATWAMSNYPADEYVLILSDHGMGWPGGWTDPTPQSSPDTSSPLSARLGNMLFLNEMDDALGQIRSQTGLDKFELVGLDACLMDQLEVLTALEPHASYAVVSEEVEPSLGWAYTEFMQQLVGNPDMSGAELARSIVQSYIEDDQSILDRQARADLLSQGSPFGGLFGPPTDVSPTQLAREIGQTSTLSAIDLSKIGTVNAALNQLAFALQGTDQKVPATSRAYAQSFTSVFGDQVPPSYVDLSSFLQLLKQNSADSEIDTLADNVLAAIGEAVVADKHGPQEPGAAGMAIYFPNSQLYQNSLTGAQSYTAIASRFAIHSLWDDFLAYHYAGQSFAETATRAVVPTGSLVRSPAAGQISVTNLSADRTDVGIGQTVTLSADISGENLGQIYLFVGYYDRGSNSVFVADQDYLESGDTRQVSGVYYPDWGAGDFTLDFDWEPVVFAVSDGNVLVPALFRPQDYGRTWEEAVYTVDGTYTFADSGEQLPARLNFIDGVMRQAFGFTGESEAGAPHEITPQAGDTFTVQEEWLDLNSTGNVVSRALQDGGTLTFGDQMFTWETLDAAAGEYVVGFVVEDLDGNRQEAFTPINVT